jgi:hypothetical protein
MDKNNWNKGFNRPKMTQNRLKNAFRRPKKFDDQIDQISYLLQKVEIYDQNRLKIKCYIIY